MRWCMVCCCFYDTLVGSDLQLFLKFMGVWDGKKWFFGNGGAFGERKVFWGKGSLLGKKPLEKNFGENGSLWRIRKSFEKKPLGEIEVFGEKTFGGKGSLLRKNLWGKRKSLEPDGNSERAFPTQTGQRSGELTANCN